MSSYLFERILPFFLLKVSVTVAETTINPKSVMTLSYLTRIIKKHKFIGDVLVPLPMLMTRKKNVNVVP